MPGVFGASTTPMAMGRVNKAIYNNAVGSITVTLRARLGGAYGLGSSSNVRLYASFIGRSYTYTY